MIQTRVEKRRGARCPHEWVICSQCAKRYCPPCSDMPDGIHFCHADRFKKIEDPPYCTAYKVVDHRNSAIVEYGVDTWQPSELDLLEDVLEDLSELLQKNTDEKFSSMIEDRPRLYLATMSEDVMEPAGSIVALFRRLRDSLRSDRQRA